MGSPDQREGSQGAFGLYILNETPKDQGSGTVFPIGPVELQSQTGKSKENEFSRRKFLKVSAVGAAKVAILAACGSQHPLATPESVRIPNIGDPFVSRDLPDGSTVATLKNGKLSESIPNYGEAPHAKELVNGLFTTFRDSWKVPTSGVDVGYISIQHPPPNPFSAELATVQYTDDLPQLIHDPNDKIYVLAYPAIDPQDNVVKTTINIGVWSKGETKDGRLAYTLSLADSNELKQNKAVKPTLNILYAIAQEERGGSTYGIAVEDQVTHAQRGYQVITDDPGVFTVESLFQIPVAKAQELEATATIIATATATVADTATARATATAFPTAEPTKHAEITPIPDPSKELETYLNSSEARLWTNAYTDAMDFKADEVSARLLQADAYKILEDAQKNQMEVLIDPQTQCPLFIKEDVNFRPIGLKDLESHLNMEAGDSLVYKRSQQNGFALVDSDSYHNMQARNYDVITLAQGTYWKWFERTKDEPIDKYSASDIQEQIRIIKQMKQNNPSLKIRIAPFGSFPEDNPDWLKGLSADEAKHYLAQHMQDLFTLLKENDLTPDEYVVVNEPYFKGKTWVRQDALYDSAGYDYITYAFQTAREIVGDKPVLLYNETANNSEYQAPYNYYTNLTKQEVKALKQADISNFAVGMQMHLFGNSPINENDLTKTMQDYGVPVYITELDVDVSMLSPQARDKALSDIYTSVFRAAIKSGVCKGISTWNGVDTLSSPVDYQGKKDASPTLFSGSTDPAPKKVYFQVLKELLSNFS